jgi:DNA-binding transcriptional LysR family regulator
MLVTLRQMQYAVAVAETGSFSKAAELCSADQSTVSQQVKVLEERLGVTIFLRDSIPVTITKQGKVLISQFKDIMDKVDNMLEPFKINRNRFN